MSGLWVLAAIFLAGCASSSRVEAPFVASLDQIEQSLDEGDLAVAMAGLNSLQADGPQDLRALALAARMHSVTDRNDALGNVVEQILAIDPANAYGLEQLGLIRLSAGELGAAENYLTLAVAMDPSRWMAWNGLGIVADADARFDEAQTNFRRALEIVPGHPKVLANLGWSRLLDEEYEDAESLLREALEIAPDSMTTQSNLAFCIAMQGRYEEAMTLYQEIYETPVAANNVGYAAMVREDLSSARKYLNMALELRPNYYRKAANNLADID
ncbi:MAG: tetratricopeptide repeat protein [Gammaproteobacteria bacterium]|nr:tetratricopeptide repeat protein [Gammaproteobacteria bacterium]